MKATTFQLKKTQETLQNIITIIIVIAILIITIHITIVIISSLSLLSASASSASTLKRASISSSSDNSTEQNTDLGTGSEGTSGASGASGTSGTSDSKPQPNNTFTIHNIKHLTFADIKKHWLSNINNNFLFVKCFTIDEDYFIAPLYIYSNRVHLGVFVLDNEIGNELANEIIIRILNADDFSVKYPVYTFMSQIQNNNKSIQIKKQIYNEKKRERKKF